MGAIAHIFEDIARIAVDVVTGNFADAMKAFMDLEQQISKEMGGSSFLPGGSGGPLGGFSNALGMGSQLSSPTALNNPFESLAANQNLDQLAQADNSYNGSVDGDAQQFEADKLQQNNYDRLTANDDNYAPDPSTGLTADGLTQEQYVMQKYAQGGYSPNDMASITTFANLQRAAQQGEPNAQQLFQYAAGLQQQRSFGTFGPQQPQIMYPSVWNPSGSAGQLSGSQQVLQAIQAATTGAAAGFQIYNSVNRPQYASYTPVPWTGGTSGDPSNIMGGSDLADMGISGSAFQDQGLSADQQQMLSGLDPNSAEYKRLVAQMKMENHMELIEFISNMMKMLHDTQMAIIGNFR